ncbi:MAG: PAS domain S-box protein, partial [Desulfomonilaceae bacterium]
MNLKLAHKDVIGGVILLCGTITALIGGLVLVGWAQDWRVLSSVRTDYIPMAPDTAMLFILSGISLVGGEVWPVNHFIRSCANGAGLLMLIVAGMSLVGSALGLDLEIVHWVLPSTGTFGAVPIGRMSPITSLSFVLSGAALFFLGRQVRVPVGIMGTLVMLIGWVNVTGYCYGAPLLYGGSVIPVALPTSLAFMLLGVGLISAAGSQEWPLSILSGISTRASLLRGLLPAILVIVLIEGWLNAKVLGKSDTIAVLESGVIDIVTVLAVFLVVSRLSRVVGDTIDRAEQTLRESEEKYRSLFETSIDGIFVTATDGTLIDANQSCLDLFGYTREEMLGRSVIKIYADPSDRDSFRHKIEEYGSVKDYPLRLIKGDGAQIDCLLTATARKASDGTILGYRGIIRDVTERKRIEEDLRKKTEMLRSMFEASPEAIIVLDPHGIVKMWNPSAERIFGWTEKEAVGCLHPIVPDSKQDEFRILRERVLRGESFSDVELTRRRKDGTVIEISVSTAPLIGPDGNVEGIFSMNADITKRKRSEEAQKRLATAVEQSIEAVMITDRNGKIQYINPAFEHISGYRKEEVIGRDTKFLKSDRLDSSFYKDSLTAIRTGKPWKGRLLSQRKDGQTFYEDVAISPVRDSSGEIVNFVDVGHDVTENVELQMQLLQAQKMESLGTLAGGIAHDFNNLLQVVLGYSEFMLQRKREGEPDYDGLQKIYQAGKRGADLVKSLLTFSRKVETKFAPVNLNQEITQVQYLLSRTIPKTIKIDLHLSGNLESIQA